MFRYPALLVFALAMAMFSSCSAPMNDVVFSTDSPKSEVWRRFKKVASSNQFSEDVGESDEGKGLFISKWNTFVAPFGLSKRSRLQAYFERSQGADASGWTIYYHIEKQEVDDISKSFEVNEDDWSAAGQDRTREEIMLGQLRISFGQDLGITPKFESHSTAWDDKR